jgi:hypothetical protein
MRVTTATNSGKHKRPRGRQQMDLFDSARPAAHRSGRSYRSEHGRR